MTIHHATVKRAAGLGITFATVLGGDIEATSQITKTVVTINAGDYDDDTAAAKEAIRWITDVDAWNADSMTGGAKLGLKVAQEDGVFVIADVKTGDQVDGSDNFDLPEDAFEAAADLAPEDDEDEAEEAGSVVPSKYKDEYKLIGIRHQDNGDFLAGIMATHTVILDGKAEVIDVDKVEALGSRNGVDYPVSGYGPAISGTRGWQGRYRMTVGNMLRPRIAAAGVCFVPASLTGGKGEVEKKPSKEWIAKYTPKPKKPKKAKAKVVAAEAAKDAKKTAKKPAKTKATK